MIVDVIIPTFNRSATLDRTLQSVFHQKFKEYILWVVDDGSTDNTSLLLKKWQSLFPTGQMKIISLSNNKGVSTARNLGIKTGQAPWVAFLDSDDEWKKNKLLQQVEWSKKYPRCPLIHTEEIWVRNGKRVNPKKKHKKRGGRIFTHNLPLCCISPSSVIIKRDFLNKIGLFREDFPVCEDYELWLRVTSQTEVGFINTPLLIKYGGHSDQLSKKYKAMDEWRVRALVGHLNNHSLTKEEKQQLLQILTQKCEILLNGYKKHKNYKNQKEIEEIYHKTKIYSHHPRKAPSPPQGAVTPVRCCHPRKMLSPPRRRRPSK